MKTIISKHCTIQKNLIRLILKNEKHITREMTEFYLNLNVAQLTIILDKIEVAPERTIIAATEKVLELQYA